MTTIKEKIAYAKSTFSSHMPDISKYMPTLKVPKGVSQIKDTLSTKASNMYNSSMNFADGWIQTPKTYAVGFVEKAKNIWEPIGEFLSGLLYSKETRDYHKAMAEAMKMSIETKEQEEERDRKIEEIKKQYNQIGTETAGSVNTTSEASSTPSYTWSESFYWVATFGYWKKPTTVTEAKKDN